MFEKIKDKIWWWFHNNKTFTYGGVEYGPVLLPKSNLYVDVKSATDIIKKSKAISDEYELNNRIYKITPRCSKITAKAIIIHGKRVAILHPLNEDAAFITTTWFVLMSRHPWIINEKLTCSECIEDANFWHTIDVATARGNDAVKDSDDVDRLIKYGEFLENLEAFNPTDAICLRARIFKYKAFLKKAYEALNIFVENMKKEA